ncbi:MAG: MFS transporter [Promethearchaeota archaeon]|nr:MAG: MFS transporter [Candidatus Lokiarchaeota archaeon]
MEKNNRSFSILSILLFIIIISFVYSTQYMISPNLELISNYFGFGGDTSPLGVLTFFYTIISGISIIVFGYLADKIIRKWILFFGSVLFSIFSILTIFIPPGVQGYMMFFLLTSINGLAFGAVIPSIFSLIGDLISQTERSKGFSFFSIASLIGTALGLLLATLAGPVDWRIAYLNAGIAGVITTILILFFREPSRIGKDFSHLVKEDMIEYSYRIKISDLRRIFKKKSNVWLIINFVDTIPTGIILFLLFEYMKQYHNIPADISLIFLGLILLSTLIGTIFFGFIGDNLFKKGNKKARVYLALFGNIFPIPFLFIALIIPFNVADPSSIINVLSNPGVIIWIILFVIGLFANGAVNGNWYATVADINLPENRATVLATTNFFDIIGRALGPLIGAFVADAFNYAIGMTTSIFFWIFIPLFWIPVLKNVINDMQETNEIFEERIEKLVK